ncbi:glutamic acid-rich protein isoform X9 [Vespula squamosa]|uniref:Glutamic acid-rich protein isoform X9 n=1 Tax=Vespula squamosa TaxID=30214 RepID=A0ABD2B8E2_VESSQ
MLSELIGEMLTLFGGLIVLCFIYILITRKNDKPSTDSPTMAHSALRELVERAVEEAKKLPGLAGSSTDNQRTNEECNISEHSYEDLLATAILNKVIEKFQREQVDGNSNVLHEKPSAKAESETELGLDEGVEEGSSSLEPLSQDECSSECSGPRSRHSRNRPEPLSLTIEERIEEVTTTYTSDEDPPECVKNGLRITNVRRVPFPELGMDIIDPSQESSDESQDEEYVSTVHVDLISPFQSWEENWLFQKKRVPIQSDPVAMLVPSSSADFKALIGDKDAEDTSDLSECSSAQSDEEIEKELIEAINNVVPRSPRISECEMVESSLNENEVVRKNIEDLHSTEKSCESIETLLTLDNKDVTISELCNGDVKCTEETNDGKNATEEIQRETKLLKNSSNDGLGKKKTNCKIEMNDTKFETGSVECEVEHKRMVDSETEMQRTDIGLLKSQKDTSPDVPMIPTPSTSENNFETVTNDVAVLDFNEKEIFNSLERAQKIMDQDINGEEDKTMLYSLDVYSKEEVHFEDGAQQESEYTEHYDTATQRHLDSLTKDDIYASQNDIINNEVLEITINNTGLMSNSLFKDETSKCREAVAFAKADSASYLSLEKIADKDIQLATPPRPGTIAEREHKKWENAPPIENNPYSKQSIQKRLLERQYSRRSADIPGIHAELPKSNGTDLVLVPNEPDIKRFGRDYYINNAKSPSGDKARKPATASVSSRPSSALSQRSGSTGTDQEQQVSFELGKFEEASLHGSLARRSYRDRHASPNFAINPLLRLEFDENFDETKIANEPRLLIEESKKDIFVADDQRCINNDVETPVDLWTSEIPSKFQNDIIVIDSIKSDNVTINPLYQPPEDERSPIISSPSDRDSGMDSIESNDLGSNKTKDFYWEKLSCSKDEINAKENQIISTNNGRYLNTFNYKYHTFGGIRNSVVYRQDRTNNFEDDDFENDVVEDNFFFGSPDFVNMKFQTFGGIKKRKKIDSKKIQTYSIIKLRPTIQMTKGSKVNHSVNRSIINDNGNKSEDVTKSGTVGEDDWLDEEEHMDARSLKRRFKSNDKDFLQLLNRNSNVRNKHKKILKRQTRIENKNNEYDEEDKKCENRDSMDDTEVKNLIGDTSNISKSLSSSNSTSYHSIDLSKRSGVRKMIAKGKLVRQHSRSSEEGKLKLEPPIKPQVIEQNFKTLKELKNSNARKKKRKDNPTNKILNIRSLSNITIW